MADAIAGVFHLDHLLGSGIVPIPRVWVRTTVPKSSPVGTLNLAQALS
jgi:hypothetical protein